MPCNCQESSCEIMKLCEELHKLEYRDKPNWMAALLFVRNIVSALSILNSKQKEIVQALVLGRLAQKDSSNDNFYQIIHEVEELLVYNEKTASWVSDLASYRNCADSMAKAVSFFVHEALETENDKDNLVASFGADMLDAISLENNAELNAPLLRDLVTNMLAHYRDEAFLSG